MLIHLLKKSSGLGLFLGLALCLAACTPATAVPTPILPVNTPSPTATAVLTPPTATPLPDSGWQLLHPGFEQRHIQQIAADGRPEEQITLFRIDPTLYNFAVAYRPGEPQSLAQWQQETGALLVVNGGFFTEDNQATGLIVVDGQPHGRSYGDFAGMFAVTAAGPELRWLGTRPYSPDEPLLYGLQAFPMLIKSAGEAAYTQEDSDQARRTVIAQDADGRLLFIVAAWGYFTLPDLSHWLANSDLNLQIALNLDGGTSTGYWLAQPETAVPSFVRLPAVITVSPK